MQDAKKVERSLTTLFHKDGRTESRTAVMGAEGNRLTEKGGGQ
jgi:hypothetical protein